MMDDINAKSTILLVDDEEDIRDVLTLSLSDLGHKVYPAENGKEAIRIFKEINPPVVLTDIKMPGIDGIELLRSIKRENPDTEVIMITGHGDMDLAIKSLKYEASDFIAKPINIDALHIALKRVLDRILMRQKLWEYTENLERLVSEKMALQDRLSSLGLMIGSISHDVKGLLTGLDGGIYLLSSGFKKNDQNQMDEGFLVVKTISSRIRKMVFDILFYAKEREIRREPVDVLGFADGVADVIEAKIKDRRIEFNRDFDKAPEEFEVDADFLRSALINILDNAVDACLEDEQKKSHKITFCIREDNTYTIIDIHDNGIGMDSDTLEKIFDLFFSSKGGKGTGFGLFISDNIIKQHGGTIRVKSAMHKGTNFIIKLPKKRHKAE
ncbi:MAG: hybrid sensor histidine kinase/response regulator [Thermodesulfobacteriota bacterium]|nr:hybrid sensor histidine kinase/response regulator [Thermodesulfobacteriota bacterium]